MKASTMGADTIRYMLGPLHPWETPITSTEQEDGRIPVEF